MGIKQPSLDDSNHFVLYTNLTNIHNMIKIETSFDYFIAIVCCINIFTVGALMVYFGQLAFGVIYFDIKKEFIFGSLSIVVGVLTMGLAYAAVRGIMWIANRKKESRTQDVQDLIQTEQDV